MIDDIVISEYLKKKGIKRSNIGYCYLIKAIQMKLDLPLNYIKISDLYGDLAKLYNKTPASIERAIRYSIPQKGIPNKVFIIEAVEEVLKQNKE